MPPAPVTLTQVPRVEAHAAAWDAIAAARSPAPFTRSWWLAVMAADLPRGSRPCYLLAHSGSRLVGGIALAEDRPLGVRRYRFLGQGVLTPDHLDLLALPGFEQAVAEAFRGWTTRPGTRILDLDGIDDGALVLRAVGGRTRPIEAAPYLPLPSTGEEFLAGLSSSFRRSLRRSTRRLADAGYSHARTRPDEAPEVLAAFWDLHRARGDRERLLTQAPLVDAAVTAGLRCGECRIDVLRDAGDPIAICIAFHVGDRLSLYQLARSVSPAHAGAGSVLLAQVIEDAIAGGCREVDLLRGEEPYKEHFTRSTRPMVALRAGHGLPGRVLVDARQGVATARSAVRSLRSR